MTKLGEFLAFVLPPLEPGELYIAAKTFTPQAGLKPGQPKPLYHTAADSLIEIEAAIQYLAEPTEAVYIAVQSYVPQKLERWAGKGKWFKKATRKQSDVAKIQCLWKDVDFKDGYKDLAEAYAAIMDFCNAIGFPPPSLFVVTGGGVHFYWRLTEAITIQQWMPLAHAFANAARHKGLKADHVCTVDAARILRPPETWNPKYDPPTMVQMGQPGASYTLDMIQAPLKQFSGPTLVASQGRPINQLVSNFTSGVVDEAQPVDLYEVASLGCEVIGNEIDTHGANASQPLWALIAMASVFDVDPRATFHAMSDGYPNYDPAATDQKLLEKAQARVSGTGWPSCQSFSNVSPKCQVCPHFGTIKSPLNLVSKAKAMAMPAAADLPAGFWRDGNEHIVGMVKVGKGEKVEAVKREVMPYPTGLGMIDAATGDLVLHVEVRGRWIFIPLAATACSGPEVGKLLYSYGICLSEHMFGAVREFLVSWLKLLQTRKDATIHRRSMGWSSDGFTYGEYTYSKGKPIPALYKNPSQVVDYQVTGSRAPWDQMMKIILDQHRPCLEVIVAAGFGATLVRLLGASSLILTIWGASGSTKSTAMRMAHAIWGKPDTGMMTLNDTGNSVIEKMASLRNLPAMWDELKTTTQNDGVVNLVMQAAQGRAKARLTQQATAKEIGTFTTMFIAASNESFADFASRASSSNSAVANRIFEIEVPLIHGSPYSVTDITNLNNKLNENYGHIGALFAAWLGANREEAERRVLQTANVLETHLKVTSDERFWVGTMSVILAGAQFANELGVTTFDVQAMGDFLIKTFHQMREARSETVQDVSNKVELEELMNDMLSEGVGKFVLPTTYVGGVGRPNINSSTNKIEGLPTNTIDRMGDIWAQHGLQDGVVRLRRRPFGKWLEKRKQSPKRVMQELIARGAKYSRAEIGAGLVGYGSHLKQGRSYCMDIDLSHLVT